MLKRLFSIAFMAWLVANVAIASPADDFDKLIIKGKQLIAEGVDKWDEKTMLEARSLFERLLQNKEMKWLAHYYIGYSDYRLAIYYQAQNKQELLVKYLDDGIEHLNASIEGNEEFADAYGLLSSLLGQKIGTDPSLGMSLGMQAATTMSDALEYGKDNPRVAMFSAVSAFYTPKQWGGSKERATNEIARSIKLYQKENLDDKGLPDWGHSEALAWQARFYLAAEKLDMAKQSLEQALKIDPKSGFALQTKQQLEQTASKK
ncbi:MAG: hypothetical protein ACE5I1_16810 [bacterium]